MKEFQIVITAITAIILFVFGLDNFSKEIQKISGERFRKILSKATNIPILGVIIGAVITAFIQSSSATTVIAISLVNSGVLSFKNSVGIIFGSNIGTTVTAQLIAFKLTSFAPAFIILGFLLSFIRTKFSFVSKSLFYFGFVFFSLNLISSTLTPLQSDERLIQLLTQNHNPFITIVFGALFTALVQSSSVTTGLAVIFAQQGLISLENAIPLVMGANIGTTATAALAMINTDIAAKKTAFSHFLFNVGGVLLFLPIIIIFKDKLKLLSSEPAVALANFHMLFNISTSIIFIISINPFSKVVDKIFGKGKMDFERFELISLDENVDFEEVRHCLVNNLEKIFFFLQENYNLVTLSIETNYKGVFETSLKRIEYLEHFKTDIQDFFSSVVSATNDENQSREIIMVISLYEYAFQLHDSIKDLTKTKKTTEEGMIELKSDLLVMIRELSSRSLNLFTEVSSGFHDKSSSEIVKKEAEELQLIIDNVNKKLLKLMSQPERKDASALIHIVTYSQRLKDKLVNYYSLLLKYKIARSAS